MPENELFYEHSQQLWEGLSQDLNFNVMFSQRGVINLAHTDAQVDAHQRRGNAMILNGSDAIWLDKHQVKAHAPLLDISDSARFPVKGGLLQARAGTARHDAVAWGYARGADARGVDIIQNCEVTGIDIENGGVVGVQTSAVPSRQKIGTAVAGNRAISRPWLVCYPKATFCRLWFPTVKALSRHGGDLGSNPLLHLSVRQG